MPDTPNLESLYDAHAQALFAFVLNLLRNETDTQDVLQELFIKVARDPEILERVRDHRAFLLRMAYNLSIDSIRRRGTRERHEEEVALQDFSIFAVTEDPDEQLYRHNLAKALSELPSDQRAVVHLKLWEGLTFERIAETLEISTNTAASRYRYGIDKLRERLRPLYEEIK